MLNGDRKTMHSICWIVLLKATEFSHKNRGNSSINHKKKSITNTPSFQMKLALFSGKNILWVINNQQKLYERNEKFVGTTKDKSDKYGNEIL